MTAVSATAAAELPQPKRHHKILNIVQNQVYGLSFGHLGKFSMVAVYFILTQVCHGQWIFHHHVHLPYIKQTWDHALDAATPVGVLKVLSPHHWIHYRHIVRAFYEGLFGMMLYMQMGFDSLKYEQKISDDEPTKVDRFMWKVPGVSNRFKPVTAGQQIMLPVWAFLTGTVLALIFFFTIEPLIYNVLHAHFLEPTLSAHPNLAQKIWQDSYVALILGVLSGFLLKRITKPVMNANMMYVCRLWTCRGGKPHAVMPPGMRYCVKSLSEHPDDIAPSKGKAFAWAMALSTIILFALSAYGVYILSAIAKA